MNKQEIEKAIELLKRSTLLDWEFTTEEHDKALKLAISALEHQLTNGWIPVSDRLPNKEGWYLISIHKNWVPVTDEFKNGHFMFYAGMTEAWQPLPEPYKEVSE